MRFKSRSNLADSQSFESSIEQNEEKEDIVKADIEKNNDKKESMTLFQSFIRSMKEKTIIAPNDIDKKQEKLIRNFYDGRRKKRSFTKIKGD